MKIDEYLRELATCTDLKKLRDDLGIIDNFPILFKIGFDDFIADLLNRGYKKHEEGNRQNGIDLIYFEPETVRIAFYNNVSPHFTVEFGSGRTPDGLVESERQLREYNVSACLHPHQGRYYMPTWQIGIAQVVRDLGEYALSKKIPICFPRTKPIVEYKPAKDLVCLP